MASTTLETGRQLPVAPDGAPSVMPTVHAKTTAAELTAGGGGTRAAIEGAAAMPDAMHLAHAASSDPSHAGEVSPSGIISLIAGTGFAAWVYHKVHKGHMERLSKHYSPQIASITGTPQEEIGVEHLKKAAEISPAFDEEIKHSKTMRNVRTIATASAAFLAFAVVVGLAAGPLAPLATGALFSLKSVALFTLTGTAGLGTMHFSLKGFTAAGKKMMGLQKPTVEKHVRALDHLRDNHYTLSREQVAAPYIAAKPAAQEYIKKNYKNMYEHLQPEQQKEVLDAIGSELTRGGPSITQVTAEINAGTMDARELLFLAHGQSSGTKHKPLHAKTETPVFGHKGQQHDTPSAKMTMFSTAESEESTKWRSRFNPSEGQERFAKPELKSDYLTINSGQNVYSGRS